MGLAPTGVTMTLQPRRFKTDGWRAELLVLVVLHQWLERKSAGSSPSSEKKTKRRKRRKRLMAEASVTCISRWHRIS